MSINKFIKDVTKLYNDLPEKQKALLNVTISNRYKSYRDNIELKYDEYFPKIEVYSMQKYRGLEGVYENIDELREKIRNYNDRYETKIHIHDNKIGLGKGSVVIIGKMKAL